MRRVPASNAWHRASDWLGLESSEVESYGTFEGNPMGEREFSVAFDTSNVLDVMFATGDGSKWMVVSWAALQSAYSLQSQNLQILLSSESSVQYDVNWDSRYAFTALVIFSNGKTEIENREVYR